MQSEQEKKDLKGKILNHLKIKKIQTNHGSKNMSKKLKNWKI